MNATIADLKIKSDKQRPTGGGGGPKIKGEVETFQTTDKQRPSPGGGRPKNEEIAAWQLKDRRKPPVGGGSPKIAAVINLYGNACMRQAAQKPKLLDTALLCYSQALEHDPDDPGLMINGGIANLVKGDILAAENLFVAAFKQSQKDFRKLYALLGLKYGHDKFAQRTELNAAETILRDTIKNCVEKDGAEESQTPILPTLHESFTAGAKTITSEEAKEFLYIKAIDTAKE